MALTYEDPDLALAELASITPGSSAARTAWV
jgi:hypothetical protein